VLLLGAKAKGIVSLLEPMNLAQKDRAQLAALRSRLE